MFVNKFSCPSIAATLLLTFSVDSFAGEPFFMPKTEIELGKALYQDKNLSLNKNQSCASCHSLHRMVKAGETVSLFSPGLFVDPTNALQGTPISRGSVSGESGSLNAPSAGYAAFSPAFHWDGNQGLYIGGQFWNGRASTLKEQAKGPFLNPKEMAMPSRWAVVTRLKQTYTQAFNSIYGLNLDQINAYEQAPAKADAPAGVEEVYDYMAKAMAAFEQSRYFNRFSSKFDFYLAGKTQLTATELKGLQLFRGKANCEACHTSKPSIAVDGSKFPPLFTDFSYDNIGLPRNINIPNNPEPDLGLGGRPDIAKLDLTGRQIGKHKVMGLRNAALTAPYGHNGVLRTLKEVVHFYNTRDTLGFVHDNTDKDFGIKGWPVPEVAKNVNKDELGNLGLTEEEEVAIVAFLKTLTDDYARLGNDPNVPKDSPSPFAKTPFPPLP